MNILFQLELLSNIVIPPTGSVLFDHILFPNTDIVYDSLTGTITVNAVGKFVINWWVATQSSLDTGGPIFALTTSDGQLITGNSPQKTAQVTGMGIIDIASVPTTIRLVCNNPNPLYLSDTTPVKAMISITQYQETFAPAYGTFYDRNGTPVATGSSLPLPSVYISSGMTISSNIVTVTNAGIYMIDFIVYPDPGITAAVTIVINSTFLIQNSVTTDNGLLNYSAVVDLPANSTLRLHNGGVPITFPYPGNTHTILRVVRIA